VARGATVVEKHFTLDRSLPGPDHRASLEPDELDAMIDRIRQVETALGSPRKRTTPSEKETRSVARKSLVAAQPIAEGEPFTTDNLTAKRPGDGISPMRYWDYLGRTAAREYAADELIEE
jgi:sialic acid synthase SpsE